MRTWKRSRKLVADMIFAIICFNPTTTTNSRDLMVFKLLLFCDFRILSLVFLAPNRRRQRRTATKTTTRHSYCCCCCCCGTKKADFFFSVGALCCCFCMHVYLWECVRVYQCAYVWVSPSKAREPHIAILTMHEAKTKAKTQETKRALQRRTNEGKTDRDFKKRLLRVFFFYSNYTATPLCLVTGGRGGGGARNGSTVRW